MRLALEDSVPVSFKTWLISLTLTPFSWPQIRRSLDNPAQERSVLRLPEPEYFTNSQSSRRLDSLVPPRQEPPVLACLANDSSPNKRQDVSTLTLSYPTVSHCPQVFSTTQQRQNDGLSGGKTTGVFGTVQQNPLGGGIFGQKITTPGAGRFGSTTTSATPAQAGTLFEGGTLGYPQNQQTTGFNGRKLVWETCDD